MIPPPHCLQKKRKKNAKNCFYLFILPDCSRFNSGPQRYAWVATPRTCKGDLIWKTIFAHIFWDEITQDLKWGLVCLYVLSGVLLSATPWTVALQASLSVEFSMPEYWSGLPCSFPGDLPYPGIEPTAPALAGWFFTTEPPGKAQSPTRQCHRDFVLQTVESFVSQGSSLIDITGQRI